MAPLAFAELLPALRATTTLRAPHSAPRRLRLLPRAPAPTLRAVRPYRAATAMQASGPSDAPPVAEGDIAPLFALPADDGAVVSLESMRGTKVILAFYPKADTPGCTTEGCDFRDQLPGFDGANAKVLYVSKDAVEDLQKFKKKHKFNFPLLSDKEGTACEDYGVWGLKKMFGREFMGITRSTFLIDEAGAIAKAWRGVKVDGHVAEVLAYIQK